MLGLGFSLVSPLVTRTGGGPAQPPAEVVELTLSAPSGTSTFAPAGFVLEVSNYGDLQAYPLRAYFDYHHIWDFGDSAAGDFEPVALPAPFLNGRNTMHGPVAAHVYEEAGTYTATCRIYGNQGQLVGQGSIDLTVEDQDAYFGQSNTIVFSEAQQFADAPAAAHQISDLAVLETQINAWSNRNRARVLFRRGETLTVSQALDSLHLNDNLGGALFGSYGDPADPLPVIRMDGTSQTAASRLLEIGSGTNSRAVFTEIKVDGRYDPVTPAYPSGVRPVNAFVCRSAHGLVHKCEVENVHIGFQALTNIDTDEFILSECTANGWSDYGALISAYRSAVIGSSIKQNPNVAFGVGGKGLAGNAYSDHGPVRCSGIGPSGNRHRHVSYANDLFSRGGWSGLAQGVTAHQPCLRLLGDSESFFRVNVCNNRLEGGQEVFALSTHAAPGVTRGYGLVEGNLLIGDEQTQNFVRASRHGIEVRSNVFQKPDVPQTIGTLNRFFTWEHPGADPTDGAIWPIKFYNNTCVNLQSAANAGSMTIQVNTNENGAPADLVVGDNILKADGAPNAGGLIDYEPLDPANFYRPLAGSTALGGSLLGLAQTDFARSYRAGPTAVGAWHREA